MNPPYDGDPNEELVIRCSDCPQTFDVVRRDLHLLVSEDGWSIRRGDNGEIIATCDGCQDYDYADGPGERDA